ncbi:MAG: YbaB/EbfC family nucleoid-associated protein [Solobacterium sp.]|nr:YbaB/EbfC family nucleoid-associated protein [Solobacterium sp.]
MDFGKLMEQAQAISANMQKEKDDLEKRVYTGEAGGSEGVKITMSGAYETLEVSISQELLNPEDQDIVQDLILLALNDVTDKIAKDKEASMGSMLGGLNIPGL